MWFKRRMTPEGLTLKFFAGSDVGVVGIDCTVKAPALRQCNFGFGGSTNLTL